MKTFGKIEGDWFYEKNTFFSGQTQAIHVEEVLYEGKSKYQDILCFKRLINNKIEFIQ